VKDKDIQINGLTPEQVQMLDMMWSIESSDDMEDWLNSLSEREINLANQLKNLLMITLIDETVEDFEMANDYLKKFQL
jgi:predicted DNA-binding protein